MANYFYFYIILIIFDCINYILSNRIAVPAHLKWFIEYSTCCCNFFLLLIKNIPWKIRKASQSIKNCKYIIKQKSMEFTRNVCSVLCRVNNNKVNNPLVRIIFRTQRFIVDSTYKVIRYRLKIQRSIKTSGY